MTFYKTYHILHFILSIVTMGFWVIPWIIITMNNMQKNKREEMKILRDTLKEVKKQTPVEEKPKWFDGNSRSFA